MDRVSLCFVKLFVLIALTFPPDGQACIFKTAVDRALGKQDAGIFLPSNARPLLKRRLSNSSCVCGPDYPGINIGDKFPVTDPIDILQQKWILYIHLNLTPTLTRVCVATVVNSNMVITSHRCLLKKDNFSIPDVWNSKTGGESAFARVQDIILSTKHSLSHPSNRKVAVKKIIYSERFVYDSINEPAPESDIAILVANVDFTQEDSPFTPICLARQGQLPTKKLVNQQGYYQGIRTWKENNHRYHYNVPVFNFSDIRTAEECNEEGRLGVKPSSGSTLCLRFTTPGPTVEGGPLRITSHRQIEGGPTRSFLAGIATWVGRDIPDAGHKYAYFSNVNSFVKYIEYQAYLHHSSWCSTPNPDEKQWPWEFYNGKIDASLDCECGYQPPLSLDGRVVGGEKAKPSEFPWLAHLFIAKGFNESEFGGYAGCGGAVINDRMILTAAHCFVSDDAARREISLNLAHFSKRLEVHKIIIHSYHTYEGILEKEEHANKFLIVKAKKILFHPGYPESIRLYRTDFDIALIILEEPLKLGVDTPQLKAIYPICLPQKGYLESIVGKNVTVAGWGVTDQTEHIEAEELRKIDVPIRPLNECLTVDAEDFEISHQFPTKTIICASHFNIWADAGKGDSGGPLMHKMEDGRFTEVGLVSFANVDYNDTDYNNLTSSYYTNVEEFLPYIYYYANEYGARFCKGKGNG